MKSTSETPLKKLRCILRSADRHWVGDGFPVQTLFSYPSLGSVLSPFLLLDHAGPAEFPPTQKRLGVGEHPHRGFETVTIVYDGEVEHRDSAGGGGKIGPGDVQWMTAASGIVHEEFHGHHFAEQGGRFEMVQLWVNLPAQDKKAAPGYQSIVSAQIPQVSLANGHGSLRVIAGEFDGIKGPAHTFTPIQVWDLRLEANQKIELNVPEGDNTMLVVLSGILRANGSEAIRPSEVGLFDRSGKLISIDCEESAKFLLLSGKPIEEPIAGYGPFVMNRSEEINQAIQDYQSGRMGHLKHE